MFLHYLANVKYLKQQQSFTYTVTINQFYLKLNKIYQYLDDKCCKITIRYDTVD